MLAYNAARNLAREGKLDLARLNRGFALAQSREFQEKAIPDHYHGYMISIYSCSCPDAVERFVTCKHQIGVALLTVAKELKE